MNIVLLPGLDGTGKLFEALVSLLPSDLSPVVCVYPKDVSMGYDELLEHALVSCPETEPYVVLGESFSGPIAIGIGANRPPLLRGLILVNTFAACPWPNLMNLLRIVPHWILNDPPKAAIKYLVNQREVDVDPTDAIKAVAKSVAVQLIRFRLECVNSVDVRHLAAKIELPVCLLQSKVDSAIPESARSLLKQVLQSSESHELPGNHFGLQTYPSRATRIISQFCRKVESKYRDDE